MASKIPAHWSNIYRSEIEYYKERYREAVIERAHRIRTNYEKVREFTEAMGQALDEWLPSEDTISLRLELINEELGELEEEFRVYNPFPIGGVDTSRINKIAIAKELADILYVTYGAAAAFGIDIDKVFAEVHKSNMSKLGADGKPIYREDGKVVKGPNYKPPNLASLGI